MKVITAASMRELDRRTIESGTPGEVLMERAGEGAFEELLWFLDRLGPRHAQRVSVVTGRGNNGGDGHVVARLLAERTSIPATVYSLCEKSELRGDALLNAERLPGSVAFVVGESLPKAALESGCVILDCLLGTGITGAVREPFAGVIAQINDSGCPVVAVDIPSGVNADTGEIANRAVRADMTVSMGLPKIGMFDGDGGRGCGLLRNVDIGIPASYIDETPAAFEAVFRDDVCGRFARLDGDAHKGTHGRVLVIGGSRRYPGAPCLAAAAAARAGAGMVYLGCPESAAGRLPVALNAVIIEPVPDALQGHHVAQDDASLDLLLNDKDVIVAGPGLGRDPQSLALMRQLLTTFKTVVLDADGLCVFAEVPNCLPRAGVTVLTPHPGEMARIIDAIGALELHALPRREQAGELARRLKAIIVLKGRGTVIAAPDGAVSVNSSGSPALAAGGSGDVLSGIIGAMLCGADDPVAAVQTAVFVHGLTAEYAPHGMRTLVADDLPELIGTTLQDLTAFA